MIKRTCKSLFLSLLFPLITSDSIIPDWIAIRQITFKYTADLWCLWMGIVLVSNPLKNKSFDVITRSTIYLLHNSTPKAYLYVVFKPSQSKKCKHNLLHWICMYFYFECFMIRINLQIESRKSATGILDNNGKIIVTRMWHQSS